MKNTFLCYERNILPLLLLSVPIDLTHTMLTLITARGSLSRIQLLLEINQQHPLFMGCIHPAKVMLLPLSINDPRARTIEPN